MQPRQKQNPPFHAVLSRLIFSEPNGGIFSWIMFLLITGSILGFICLADWEFIKWGGVFILGLAGSGWAESLAEILPRRQWKLAGAIRILGWSGLLLSFGWGVYLLATLRR